MKTKLFSIGVHSADDFTRLRNKKLFSQLKEQYTNVSLLHVPVLQGAIDYVGFNQLPERCKA